MYILYWALFMNTQKHLCVFGYLPMILPFKLNSISLSNQFTYYIIGIKNPMLEVA